MVNEKRVAKKIIWSGSHVQLFDGPIEYTVTIDPHAREQEVISFNYPGLLPGLQTGMMGQMEIIEEGVAGKDKIIRYRGALISEYRMNFMGEQPSGLSFMMSGRELSDAEAAN